MKHQKGIHHITALAGDAQRNAEFYTQILGMRLVKKSVNQDDPGTYHLFYGNQSANPGSSLTFFPWPQAIKGKPGTGEVVNVGLQVPEGTQEFWESRLSDHDVNFEVKDVFGRTVLRFNDPDGMELDLVFEGTAKEKVENVDYIVPYDKTIQGFWGARMYLTEREHTQKLIHELFEFEEVANEGNQFLYQTEAEIGHSVIIEVADAPVHGQNGRGIVHHIAFRAENKEELDQLREKVNQRGLNPTQIIDRHWFNSVYYRIPAGVLFEMASDDPGYTVDEEFEHLGEHLILPPWLENKRDRIEQILPEINMPSKATR
ncbi:VOC family protein [Gracilimonas sp. BCB1]|uniref:VOC family protein n=1 Tax=Gracilimonas sp. BCB1 TaxID=3152362 RepID=UPI0032D9908F